MSVSVDESRIRKEVLGRKYPLNYRIDALTPTGRPRSTPLYVATISNAHLGKSRELKGKSLWELQEKANDQYGKWIEQEIRQLVRQANKDADETAADEHSELVQTAQRELDEVNGILAATLDVDDRIDWSTLLDRSEFPPFTFEKEEPKMAALPSRPEPAKPSFWEWLIPSMKRRRLETDKNLLDAFEIACDSLKKSYSEALANWQNEKEAAQVEHEQRRIQFVRKQEAHNKSVGDFKKRFEQGDREAVEEYLREVFERSEYPEHFFVEHAVNYDPHSQTVVVDVSLPSQDDIVSTVDYKFVKKTLTSTPVPMKNKEHDALYDNAIKQTVLRTIHEVYEAEYVGSVANVVVNGWVTYLNKATGNEDSSCVISVQADREPFEAINLARVDPGECVRGLKGIVAGPLSSLAPVQPIMKLDMEDSRFVESQAVLAELNSTTNLAEIPWEEFEHLVRELFTDMFSGPDAKVSVTQASKDGGVDAIAFDPDPIRGGKFVIQAKRYTKVVPVSAVRDLYGTMINEGAAKGILVTTAHYGRDSRAFADSKPMTLIDGANLVYLLEKHGHKVRLDVDEARRNRLQ